MGASMPKGVAQAMGKEEIPRLNAEGAQRSLGGESEKDDEKKDEETDAGDRDRVGSGIDIACRHQRKTRDVTIR